MTGLLRLAFEFFKTGLFAVGGGLATLPFLYAMGTATGWFNAQGFRLVLQRSIVGQIC